MSTHNICFHGEIRKIFTGYPPLSRLMNYPRNILNKSSGLCYWRSMKFKYWHRHARTKNVDPDHSIPKGAIWSGSVLLFLLYFLNTSLGNQIDLFKFRTRMDTHSVEATWSVFFFCPLLIRGFLYILLTGAAYLWVIAFQHFLNDPHSKQSSSSSTI